MRVDKYIWSVRLAKTRVLASKECTSDKIKLNNESVKPSKVVQIGDVLEIKNNTIWLKFKILDIPKSRVGAKLVDANIQNITPVGDLELLNQIELINKQNKVLGIKGRPTKKIRRTLDDIFDK